MLMTLFKQILVIICIVFITLFISTFFVSTGNIRDYLNEQLSSHAQDAATSLGIALTAEIGDNDVASMETYTNAMFDSGYYKEIIIKDIDDKILFQKNLPVIIDEVPAWFISLFPLHAPHQQASVENGWQTVGTITIQSYPGFAYKKLWKNTLNTLQIYLLVMFAILFITAFALKFLLKPLLAIRQQAEAICNREFPIISIKPKTIEFLQLVTALNKMSKKLKETFTEQTKMTEDLQKQAFQDGLTGLPNRSFFIKQLKYFCAAKNETMRGCLVILQINDLIQVNKEYGHVMANDLLKTLAELLNSTSERFPNSLVARLSGSEFVLLIKSITPDVINELGADLQSKLAEIVIKLEFKDDDIAHIGMVIKHNNCEMADLLSDADLALKFAQQKGVNAFHLYDNKQTQSIQTQGIDAWHGIILDAIKNNCFQLYFQKTVDTDNQSAFQEIMLRLNNEDQVISAGIFIPMAEHLDMTRFIDRWVIEKIIALILSGSETIYFINLSRDTLRDPVFPTWIKEQLSLLSIAQQKQMVIEVSEYNIIKAMAEYQNLLNIMQAYACKFSIDHFGIGFVSMSYLQDIKIDYIKVHGSYAANIRDNNDMVNYLRQLISIAHNLDIKIIAEGIEREADLEVLKKMKLDFYQGYFIGRPDPEQQ